MREGPKGSEALLDVHREGIQPEALHGPQRPEGHDVLEMRLTPSQRRVLRLIGTGLTYKEVAAALDRSHDTVRATASAAYQQLGVTHAVEAFLALGWLQIPVA